MSLGGLLVGKALRHAGEGGAGKLKLYARPWNAAMRAICLALGFVEEAFLRQEYLGEDLVQYSYFYR